MSDALDPFINAKITYKVNNSSVTYTYSGERWSQLLGAIVSLSKVWDMRA